MRILPAATIAATLMFPTLLRDSADTVARTGQISYALPADYEPVQQLLLPWHDEYAAFFVDVAAAAQGHVELVVVLDITQDPDETVRDLATAGLQPGDYELVVVPIETMWLRDFGPLITRASDGQRGIVDTRYFSRGDDDEVPYALAEQLWPDIPIVDTDVQIEGGNLLSDGAGRCVTTTLTFESLDRDQRRAARRQLRTRLGCHRLIVLERLFGESTGHVDVFAIISGPRRIVLGDYDRRVDPENAAVLDRNAARLRRAGFTVDRIPMPSNTDGAYRTYTNAVLINDVVLAPVYADDRSVEDDALAVLRYAFPNRAVVPVDATSIIQLAGAIHCATMTVAR
jgi:agmatine/peptidylarginine deiminase